MYEARISYIDGRKHTIEANTIEQLKEKCKYWTKDINVYEIFVVKVEGVGWIKSELGVKLL